jgi:hypothetical protein
MWRWLLLQQFGFVMRWFFALIGKFEARFAEKP